MLSAGRTRNLVFLDKRSHLLLSPGIHRSFQGDPLFLTEILDQLIRTETLMALFTVHQGIGKSAQMSGCHPGLRIHQYRTVYAHIIGGFLNKLLPPCFFNVILQFHAKIAVVPCIRQASVDLGTGIYETSRLCKGHNLFHRLFYHTVCSSHSFFHHFSQL